MQPRPGRREWEYRTVRYYGESSGKMFATHMNGGRIGMTGATGVGTPELHTFLNQLGVEGWEVVGFTGGTSDGLLLLKREVLYG